MNRKINKNCNRIFGYWASELNGINLFAKIMRSRPRGFGFFSELGGDVRNYMRERLEFIGGLRMFF